MDSNERINVLEGRFKEFERKFTDIERFMCRWTSGDEAVAFKEPSAHESVLDKRLSNIENSLMELTDRLLALELHVNEIHCEWPTPHESSSRLEQEKQCRNNANQCSSKVAKSTASLNLVSTGERGNVQKGRDEDVEKSISSNVLNELDSSTESIESPVNSSTRRTSVSKPIAFPSDINSSIYIYDEEEYEDMCRSQEGVNHIGKGLSASSEFKQAARKSLSVKIIGDSMIKNVGVGLEQQSGGIFSCRSIAGGKIEHITKEVAKEKNDKNRHLILIVGTNNLVGDDSTSILKKYELMINEAKQVEHRKLSVVGIGRRYDCNNSVESKRSVLNIRIKEMCRANEIEFISFEMSRGKIARDGVHLNSIGQHQFGHILMRHSLHFLG